MLSINRKVVYVALKCRSISGPFLGIRIPAVWTSRSSVGKLSHYTWWDESSKGGARRQPVRGDYLTYWCTIFIKWHWFEFTIYLSTYLNLDHTWNYIKIVSSDLTGQPSKIWGPATEKAGHLPRKAQEPWKDAYYVSCFVYLGTYLMNVCNVYAIIPSQGTQLKIDYSHLCKRFDLARHKKYTDLRFKVTTL